jgi:hypothetical protein|nr:MAG TPA: hypothetical protein [Caudoviricetes sp.]
MDYEFIKTEPRPDDKEDFIFHYDCPKAEIIISVYKEDEKIMTDSQRIEAKNFTGESMLSQMIAVEEEIMPLVLKDIENRMADKTDTPKEPITLSYFTASRDRYTVMCNFTVGKNAGVIAVKFSGDYTEHTIEKKDRTTEESFLVAKQYEEDIIKESKKHLLDTLYKDLEYSVDSYCLDCIYDNNELKNCKCFIITSYDHLSQKLLNQINRCEKDFLVQAKATITTYYGEEEIKGTIKVWVLREAFDNEGICKLKMFGTQHPTNVILKRDVNHIKE